MKKSVNHAAMSMTRRLAIRTMESLRELHSRTCLKTGYVRYAVLEKTFLFPKTDNLI